MVGASSRPSFSDSAACSASIGAIDSTSANNSFREARLLQFVEFDVRIDSADRSSGFSPFSGSPLRTLVDGGAFSPVSNRAKSPNTRSSETPEN